jgi:hypothetical protein
MRKLFLGLAATAAIATPFLGTVPASAAIGDEFISNGSFSEPTVDGLLDTPNTTTDFALATPGMFGNFANAGLGSMYDPGRYTIASNPASLHEFWADFGNGDPMMIVNGHTEGSHVVWAQDADLSGATPTSVTTLWAGQNINVGTVTVSPDPNAAGQFCVNYDLSDSAVAEGYEITETHIATGANPADIPQKNGNPRPGQFAYNNTYNPAVTEATVCSVNEGAVVAAHAALTKTVNGVVVGGQTGWSEGPKFTGKNWATYSAYDPTVKFQFSMNATNILRQGIVPGEAGAHLVVKVNGVQIGEADLTGQNPGNLIEFAGSVAPAATAHVEIVNTATQYSGNDFAIDDISLTQVS